jgi:hypothetical protein
MANFMSDNVRPGAMFPVDATTVAKPEDFNMLTYQQPSVAPGVPTGGQLTPASTQPAVPFDAVPAMSGQQLVPPAPPPPPMVVESSSQQKVMSKAAIDADTDAQIMEAIAADHQRIADEEENKVRADIYKGMTDQVKTALEAQKQAAAELSGKKVIDPMDKWGTGQRIGAAIAMGLGAFSAAFSGTKNFAAEIIDENIKRDIALQEREMQRLGKNVDLKNNALAALYSRLGDMDQAKDVFYMAAIAGADDKVKERAAAAKNGKVDAAAARFSAELARKRAESVARATERVVSSTVRTDTTKAPKGEINPNETSYGMTASPQAANVVREKAKEIDESRQGLKAFNEVMSKYGSWNLVPGEAKGEYQAALLPVVNAYRVAQNLGVLNPSEGAKIESEIKNKLSTKEAVAFINGMQKRIDQSESALIRAYIVGAPRSQQSNAQKLKSQVGFQ